MLHGPQTLRDVSLKRTFTGAAASAPLCSVLGPSACVPRGECAPRVTRGSLDNHLGFGRYGVSASWFGPVPGPVVVGALGRYSPYQNDDDDDDDEDYLDDDDELDEFDDYSSNRPAGVRRSPQERALLERIRQAKMRMDVFRSSGLGSMAIFQEAMERKMMRELEQLKKDQRAGGNFAAIAEAAAAEGFDLEAEWRALEDRSKGSTTGSKRAKEMKEGQNGKEKQVKLKQPPSNPLLPNSGFYRNQRMNEILKEYNAKEMISEEKMWEQALEYYNKQEAGPELGTVADLSDTDKDYLAFVLQSSPKKGGPEAVQKGRKGLESDTNTEYVKFVTKTLSKDAKLYKAKCNAMGASPTDEKEYLDFVMGAMKERRRGKATVKGAGVEGPTDADYEEYLKFVMSSLSETSTSKKKDKLNDDGTDRAYLDFVTQAVIDSEKAQKKARQAGSLVRQSGSVRAQAGVLPSAARARSSSQAKRSSVGPASQKLSAGVKGPVARSASPASSSASPPASSASSKPGGRTQASMQSSSSAAAAGRTIMEGSLTQGLPNQRGSGMASSRAASQASQGDKPTLKRVSTSGGAIAGKKLSKAPQEALPAGSQAGGADDTEDAYLLYVLQAMGKEDSEKRGGKKLSRKQKEAAEKRAAEMDKALQELEEQQSRRPDWPKGASSANGASSARGASSASGAASSPLPPSTNNDTQPEPAAPTRQRGSQFSPYDFVLR